MNYRQIKAIEAANKKRILEICPECPEDSGIYFLTREENGFKFAYVGKAKHLLTRLAQHLSGYQQHIDRSIKKHGLWKEDNPTGYSIDFLLYPESQLDEQEQHWIRHYANAGYQMRNVETGGTKGKTTMNERRPSRGYYDGLEAGKRKAREEMAHLFRLHLDYAPKPRNGKPPTKLQLKALQRMDEIVESFEE